MKNKKYNVNHLARGKQGTFADCFAIQRPVQQLVSSLIKDTLTSCKSNTFNEVNLTEEVVNHLTILKGGITLNEVLYVGYMVGMAVAFKHNHAVNHEGYQFSRRN